MGLSDLSSFERCSFCCSYFSVVVLVRLVSLSSYTALVFVSGFLEVETERVKKSKFTQQLTNGCR